MSEQRTEQPTQRRLERARKEGRAGASSEVVIAIQLTCAFYIGRYWLENYLPGMTWELRRIYLAAFTTELTPVQVSVLYRSMLRTVFLPLVSLGAILGLSAVFFQAAVARVPIVLSKMGFDIQRLNPVSKLGSLPKQNAVAFCKSLVISLLFLWVSWNYLSDRAPVLMRASAQSIPYGLAALAESCRALMLRLIGCALFVGLIDFAYQRWTFQSSLKMTKQEVTDEHKESEGRPEVKMRLRRLRRDLKRKRMMREVPKATFVVVNPTHFAVAIRYQLETMAAPVVVAKGKNYIALRIKTLALSHQVPIIENPPLAQALYKSASVGQEIPPQLYQAVAEILAYIYRLLNGRLPG